MPPPKKKKPDPLVLLARAAARDRRRRSPLALLIALLLLVGLLGLIAWWLWPAAGLPPILMAAYDQVAVPGETVPVCARVEPVNAEDAGANLGGVELFFKDFDAESATRVTTNADGLAHVERTFTAAAPGPLVADVQYPGIPNRRRGTRDSARVFVLAPETSPVAIDLVAVLADADLGKLADLHSLGVRPRPGAAAALRKARAKHAPVYVAVGVERPSVYNRLRAWLEREQFPAGPVLCPACAPDLDRAGFWRETASGLKKRFAGKVIGVTGQGDVSGLLREAGLDVLWIADEGEPRDGVVRVKSWDEAARRLAD